MNQKIAFRVISAAGIIGTLFGIVYSFWGLGVLPVEREVLVPWGNGVYGSTFIGLSVIIFLVGRHAIQTKDEKLKQALFYGLIVWLVVEFLFSIYYAVFFNAAVDIALAILFGLPLMRGEKKQKK
jgi:hypothetical protein